MSVEFSPEARKRLEGLLGQYPNPRAALLAVLRFAQEEFGHVSPEVEGYLADLLQIPPAAVREVVSFYTLLHTTRPGTHVIHLCRNLACHLRRGGEIREHVERKLGIQTGETTADGRFTLLDSECLGGCEIAPMMEVDGEYYGPLTPEYVDEILNPLLLGSR